VILYCCESKESDKQSGLTIKAAFKNIVALRQYLPNKSGGGIDLGTMNISMGRLYLSGTPFKENRCVLEQVRS
jgi:hypothetical protein